ncbi:MAG: aminotransferase class III-fold pyridoxal phosphate-dependent enzyme, partial [Myxococcota bacterium]
TGATYVVRLGSTGAEAVEMALAHALLERAEHIRKTYRELRQTAGRFDPNAVQRCIEQGMRLCEEHAPQVLVLSTGFHGHSLGARSALGSNRYRHPFTTLSRIERIIVRPDVDLDQLHGRVARATLELPTLSIRDGRVVPSTWTVPTIIAALAEPVLGEGGVRRVPRALLKALSTYEFPLILDEIQCGLGRTGSLLASDGVAGDYYLFAKALGGGFAKVSALLIERQRYVERFDEHYASTFAGDPLSSSVALAVLDVIEHDDVPGRAQRRGRALRAAIERVCEAYPGVFVGVRGKGLMLGLELDTKCARESLLLRGLVRHEQLGALAASALLHHHRVRLLPTLSAPHTLRVEPSAYVSDEAIEQLETALRWLGRCLRDRELPALVGHLVDSSSAPSHAPSQVAPVAGPRIDTSIERPAPSAVRVGFVNHFVHPVRELALAEPSLGRLPPAERRALFQRFMELLELDPVIGFARRLLDDRLWFLSVVNAADAAIFETIHRSRDRAEAIERVQRSVDLAASEGCSVIALGAYSSILTDNGLAIVPPPGTRVISGNTLTVAVATRRIRDACRCVAIDPAGKDAVLGIVGAPGNIGTALSEQLLTGDDRFRRAVLISRKGTGQLPARLSQLDADITLSNDLSSLRGCNVIALAVNTTEPLLLPHHLGSNLHVVADVSVPMSVAPSVRRASNVHFVPAAGVVALPSEPDFVMSGHSPKGTAFCCAAEAMLVGLEPEATRALRLVGSVDADAVAALDSLAECHAWLDPRSGGKTQ